MPAVSNVNDVARYIIENHGPMTAMKLQKLLYYCQAWSLVWDEQPMFDDEIEAWANGPVIPTIYSQHRGTFKIEKWSSGDTSKLSKDAIETIEGVMSFYGDKTAQWLSDLTHQEDPWVQARKGLAPGEPGSNVITTASMHEYYSSLSD